MEPGILVNPYTLVVRVGRQDLLEFVFAVGKFERDLVVARGHVAFVREHPDLQEFDRFVYVFIVLAVPDARAGAHHLDIAIADDGHVAHAVFVFEVAFERDGDDLHVVMRVGAEAFAAHDGVVVEHAQHAEVHAFGVVVVGEGEGVVTVEPAVVGVAAGFGFMQNGVCHNF